MQRARDMEISPVLPGSRRHAKIGCAFHVLFNKPPGLQNALQNTRKKLRENSTFVIGIHNRLGVKSLEEIIQTFLSLIFQNISFVQRESSENYSILTVGNILDGF